MRTLSHSTIALALLLLGVPADPAHGSAAESALWGDGAQPGPWSALADPIRRAVAAQDPVEEPVEEPEPTEEPEEGQGGEEGSEGDEPTVDDQFPEAGMAPVSKVDRLGRALLEAHGGVEAINAFKSLQFTVTPVLIVPVENPLEGEPEFEEERRAPIEFQASFDADVRMMRMDEPVELRGAQMVTTKILRVAEQGNEVGFFLDGKKRTVIAETRAQIIQDLYTLVGQFDILLGLGTGQLVGEYDGEAERDGMTFETVVAQFFGGLQPEKTFRLYLNPETHLVDRYDLYDTQSRRLVNKLTLSGYATHAGLQLPSAITFHNRRSVPFMRWEFTNYRLNEEIDPVRFAVDTESE